LKSLQDLVFQCIRGEGFEEVGAVDLEAPEVAEALAQHVARYDHWISRGFHGLMSYLVRGRDRRSDPRLVLPGTQTIISALKFSDPRPYGDGVSGPQYARYLRGVGADPDYHHALTDALTRAMERARSEWVAKGGAPFAFKVCVDTSAVLERTWANLAGVGWLGKNSLLIHTQRGSYSFIGTVLLDVALEVVQATLPQNLCGSCTRCVDACPTQALVPDAQDSSRFVLNSTQCISYWTLEARGELNLLAEQKQQVGTWVAGCDVCQDVCPFNLKAIRGAKDDFGAEQSQPPSWSEHQAEQDDPTGDRYKKRAKISALSRIKPEEFKRNLMLALENANQARSTVEKQSR
jgi:epoxyqueuosine reductase